MMLVFSLVLCALVSVTVRAAFPQDDWPWGVSIGPSMITAADINVSGTTDSFSFPVTAEYRAYFDDVLQNFDHWAKHNQWWAHTSKGPDGLDSAKAERIGQDLFQTLLSNLTRILTFEPKVAALAVPPIFNRSCKEALVLAVFPPEQWVDYGSWQEGRLPLAAVKAYGLEKCRMYGRSRRECTREVTNFALVVEYHPEYLNLALLHEWEEYNSAALYLQRVEVSLGERNLRVNGGQEARLRVS